MIQQIIIMAHILVCVLMVGAILLQQGKGADAGASFGSGGSQTVLGASGSISLLTRLTTALAVLFFLLSFALAYFANNQDTYSTKIGSAEKSESVTSEVPEVVESSADAKSSEGQGSDVPSVESSSADEAISDVPGTE